MKLRLLSRLPRLPRSPPLQAHALQALTPRALAEAVPGLTPSDARLVVAAVHRGEPLDRPIPRVSRAALEAIRAACSVPEL